MLFCYFVVNLLFPLFYLLLDLFELVISAGIFFFLLCSSWVSQNQIIQI